MPGSAAIILPISSATVRMEIALAFKLNEILHLSWSKPHVSHVIKI